MDDALLMRRFERLGNLPRDRQGLVERDRSLGDPIGQRRAFHQFKHQRAYAVGVFQAVDAANVRMTQRGQRLCFALEACDPLGIRNEQLGQDLDRDFAIELSVSGAIDLAHPARAEQSDDLVGAEVGARGESHRFRQIISVRW
jgi:hypothetical protein